MQSKVWKAFLPVPPLPREAHLSPDDEAWFAARDVDRERLIAALAVLRCVRESVAGALSYLCEHRLYVEAFQFLVHDPPPGVTSPDGSPGCVDLTLRFVHAKRYFSERYFPGGWQCVGRAEKTTEIAGVDAALLGGVHRAQRLIERQSAWYLDLVNSYSPSVSDVDVLKQVGQFLHYFANMSQMVVA